MTEIRSIALVDPRTDPLWKNLTNRVDSSVFHSSEWISVLSDTYDFEFQGLVGLDELGEPRAGVPFGRISDMMGERISIIPFSDYCDPLVDNASQWNRLIDSLLKQHLRITARCLHNTIPLDDERFALANRAKWHGLDLRSDLEEIWRGLDESARRAIRKAEKDGVVVRLAESKQDLRSFFEMHLSVRKHKYRLLPQPYRFFENIWSRIIEPGKGLLAMATYRDQVVGGVVFLRWKDTLYYKFNASQPSQLNRRPNDLLMWYGIRRAKAMDHHYLDLGLSDWDQAALVRYKRKYATEEKTIFFLRHEPNQVPSAREAGTRQCLTELTSLFVDESVPDAITARAGDVLYRYFV